MQRLELIWYQNLCEDIGQVVVNPNLDQITDGAVSQSLYPAMPAVYMTQFRMLSRTLSKRYCSRIIDQNVDRLDLPKTHLLVHISDMQKFRQCNA